MELGGEEAANVEMGRKNREPEVKIDFSHKEGVRVQVRRVFVLSLFFCFFWGGGGGGVKLFLNITLGNVNKPALIGIVK